jgi:hypothetical protein
VTVPGHMPGDKIALAMAAFWPVTDPARRVSLAYTEIILGDAASPAFLSGLPSMMGVPEPPALALLVLGTGVVLGLGWWNRRQTARGALRQRPW